MTKTICSRLKIKLRKMVTIQRKAKTCLSNRDHQKKEQSLIKFKARNSPRPSSRPGSRSRKGEGMMIMRLWVWSQADLGNQVKSRLWTPTWSNWLHMKAPRDLLNIMMKTAKRIKEARKTSGKKWEVLGNQMPTASVIPLRRMTIHPNTWSCSERIKGTCIQPWWTSEVRVSGTRRNSSKWSS